MIFYYIGLQLTRRIRSQPQPFLDHIKACCSVHLEFRSFSNSSDSHQQKFSDFRRVSKMQDSAATTKPGVSHHISEEMVAKGKWICLNNIKYSDPTGTTRSWEAVGRTTRNTGEADAVGIIATLRDDAKGGQCVVLVRQYRPPLKTYTIEFPAGLIDPGESADQTAVREMKEETGYTVNVDKVMPATALDAGIGNTTLKLVLAHIDTSLESNNDPKAVGGGADEFVQVFVEPTSTLMEKLTEFSNNGDVVDSRVFAWAMGMQCRL